MITELASPLSFKSNIVVLKQRTSAKRYKSDIPITNESKEHIAVKIKCNARNLYATRTRHIIIEPSNTKSMIIVTRKEFVDVSPKKIENHKLLLEYVQCEADTTLNDQAFWEEAKSNIQKKILKLTLNEEDAERKQLESSLNFDEGELDAFKSIFEMSPRIEDDPVIEHRPVKRSSHNKIEDEKTVKLKECEVEGEGEFEGELEGESEKSSEIKETEQFIKDKDTQSEINDIEEQVLKTRTKKCASEGYEKEKAKNGLNWRLLLFSLIVVPLMLLVFNYGLSS